MSWPRYSLASLPFLFRPSHAPCRPRSPPRRQARMRPVRGLRLMMLFPFTGNVELKARLDAPGKLMVAGERMHGRLLRRFYVAHGYQTVWDSHPVEASRLMRDAVLRASEHGLDPGLFHGAALGDRGPNLSPVERDLLLSDAFLSYADALARGAMPIEDRIDDEDLTPEPVDVAAVLDAAIAAADPAKVIEALAPASPEYEAMRRAYAEYRAARRRTQGARGKPERAPSGTAQRQPNSGCGSSSSTSSGCAGCRARCRGTGSSSMRRSRGCSCSATTGRYSRRGSSSAKSTSKLPSFNRRSMTFCSTRPGTFRGRSRKRKSCRNWRPIPVTWPATT